MNPKKKALEKASEKRIPHKAIGGTIHFSNPKSSEHKKFVSHKKLLANRKPGYEAWRSSLGKNK